MYLLLESSVGTIAESKPWHATDTTEKVLIQSNYRRQYTKLSVHISPSHSDVQEWASKNAANHFERWEWILKWNLAYICAYCPSYNLHITQISICVHPEQTTLAIRSQPVSCRWRTSTGCALQHHQSKAKQSTWPRPRLHHSSGVSLS